MLVTSKREIMYVIEAEMYFAKDTIIPTTMFNKVSKYFVIP